MSGINVQSVITACIVVAVAVLPSISLIFPGLLEGHLELGIDLGTTYSVVATCSAGKVTVVPVDGATVTPSVAFFNESSQYQLTTVQVGHAAWTMRDLHPESTIYDSKRLIGRDMEDPQVVQEAAALSYPVEADVDGRAVACMLHRRVRPEETGTMILKKLKQAAEERLPWAHRLLGGSFNSVTISVPVSFPEPARAATEQAAHAAGFKVVRLLQEPVAAAMAYDLHRQPGERLVMVYDFGGGTLDVAVLSLDPGQGAFNALGTQGDPHLGGEDVDRALAARYLALLRAEVPLSEAQQADFLPWLTHAAEYAKRGLSASQAVPLDLDTVHHAHGGAAAAVQVSMQVPPSLREAWGALQGALDAPGMHLTQERLEEACAELLDRAVAPVHSALAEAGVRPADVDDVVMVGGSSRLAAVRLKLREVFGDKLRFDLDPDTAIAVGAARSWACRV